jgi:alpha-1,3-rhamnosyl/mannosyltransferase
VAALLLRRSVRSARVVVTASQAAREDVLRVLGASAERAVVIPHGVDRRFVPQPEAAIAAVRERFGLPAAYVLHVSSGKPHKNVARLLDAWRVVAGSGSARGAVLAVAGGDATAQGAAFGPDPTVRFLGPIREDDLPGLYAGARLFVFPSLLEGFGLPVLEAMACGAPVVCSNASSLPEVAGDAAVLCDPNDTAALAAAVARVLADPDVRADLRQRGLARAVRFTWEEAARRFAQVYRDALAQGPRSGRFGGRR